MHPDSPARAGDALESMAAKTTIGARENKIVASIFLLLEQRMRAFERGCSKLVNEDD
jgi:hypothetical protein